MQVKVSCTVDDKLLNRLFSRTKSSTWDNRLGVRLKAMLESLDKSLGCNDGIKYIVPLGYEAKVNICEEAKLIYKAGTELCIRKRQDFQSRTGTYIITLSVSIDGGMTWCNVNSIEIIGKEFSGELEI